MRVSGRGGQGFGTVLRDLRRPVPRILRAGTGEWSRCGGLASVCASGAWQRGELAMEALLIAIAAAVICLIVGLYLIAREQAD